MFCGVTEDESATCICACFHLKLTSGAALNPSHCAGKLAIQPMSQIAVDQSLSTAPLPALPHLSIKTQKLKPQISMGFAASAACSAPKPAQDLEDSASRLEGSGEWLSEGGDNAFWEEGAVLELASYDEPASPGDGTLPISCCLHWVSVTLSLFQMLQQQDGSDLLAYL